MNKQGLSSGDQSPLEASYEKNEHSVESKEQKSTAADPSMNVKFTTGKSPCVMKFSFWSSQKAVKHIAKVSQEGGFASPTAASGRSEPLVKEASEERSDKMCQQEDASMTVPVNAATMSNSRKD